MEEIWRDIPGYEGRYQVSNLGRVKSLPRVTTRVESSGRKVAQPILGRILRDSTNKSGYRYVVLRSGGKSVTREVHVLVAAAFLGPRPNEEQQVRHLNGNRLDCSVENLSYGTRSQNQLDLYDYRGFHHRLTPDDVLEIRRRLELGETGRSLAKEFGVCESNISAIKHGGTFKWLS